MRKIVLVALLMAGVLAPDRVSGESRLSVLASGGVLRHADSSYRDLYGSTVFYPELTFRAVIYKDVFAWAGFGYFSGSGKTELLGYDAETSRNILSLGVGTRLRIVEGLFAVGDVGLCRYGYRETAMEMEVKGSAIGLRLDAGLAYDLTKSLVVEARFGYLSGSDECEGESFKLGGVLGSLALGLRF
ncbi:MAG: hypothetical protein OEW05_04995 [Candidatus Aminicenantes bacterium]|nr:hypothetical protein [Candidatus Aminicenantes bacterium]